MVDILGAGSSTASAGKHPAPREERPALILVSAPPILAPLSVSKSLTRISKRTSQSSREQHDGSGIEEGGCRGDRSFEILCEAAVSPKPCQEAFDHPTPGMDGEANLTGLLADNLDDDPGRVRHPFAGIGAIGENPLDERQQCT